jgi:hypothetical protein
MFNATFSNISSIPCQPVLVVEEVVGFLSQHQDSPVNNEIIVKY